MTMDLIGYYSIQLLAPVDDLGLKLNCCSLDAYGLLKRMKRYDSWFISMELRVGL